MGCTVVVAVAAELSPDDGFALLQAEGFFALSSLADFRCLWEGEPGGVEIRLWLTAFLFIAPF